MHGLVLVECMSGKDLAALMRLWQLKIFGHSAHLIQAEVMLFLQPAISNLVFVWTCAALPVYRVSCSSFILLIDIFWQHSKSFLRFVVAWRSFLQICCFLTTLLTRVWSYQHILSWPVYTCWASLALFWAKYTGFLLRPSQFLWDILAAVQISRAKSSGFQTQA